MTVLATPLTRLVWFNSILEAASLSDDHIDYIQQLINLAVRIPPPKHPQTVENNHSQNQNVSPFISSNSTIPELLVSLVKGDYMDIFLHPQMYEILTILSKKYNFYIELVKNDPNQGLKCNLINIFAQTIYDWLNEDQEIEINQIKLNIHTKHDEKQCLVIILGIAAMNLFSQVNYAGLPLVIPCSREEFRDNSIQHTKITENSENNVKNAEIVENGKTVQPTTTTTPSLQDSVTLFFDLFSQRTLSNSSQFQQNEKNDDEKNENNLKEILLLTSPQFLKNSQKNRQLNVQKNILLNGSLKLNGEDTYQCSYFPLFLIIARAIFGSESSFFSLFDESDTKTTPTVQNSNISVFSLVIQHQFVPLARQNIKSNDKKINFLESPEISLRFSYFSCPALLHYVLRSLKLHSEIMLATTSAVRTEYYTLSILYQVLYGVLCSNTTFQQCQSICSEFKCIPFQPFHRLIQPIEYSDEKTDNNKKTVEKVVFHTVASAITRLLAFIPSIHFVDVLSGQDFSSEQKVEKSEKTQKNEKSEKTEANGFFLDVNKYNSMLLTTYNTLAHPSTSTPQLTNESSTQNNAEQQNDEKNEEQMDKTQLFAAQMENNIDDMHAVGISPLTHKHIHTTYTPLVFLSPNYMNTPEKIKNVEKNEKTSTSSAAQLASIVPLTLSTTLLSSITIELSHIALKLYAYKRSFLLLSLSKIFSGVCIFVSGVLGRKTRYQSRSFAQLHGTSFIHKDIMDQITKDAVQGIKFKDFGFETEKTGLFDNKNENFEKNDYFVDPKYIICNDITDTLVAQYIVDVKHEDELKPVIKQDSEKTKNEKENYKGVINERNPTIPRISTLLLGQIDENQAENTIIEDETTKTTQKSQKNKQKFVVCITHGGHVEDVPIDSVDDLYLTYMLPDQDNYSVDEEQRKKSVHKKISKSNNLDSTPEDDVLSDNKSTEDDEEPPKMVVKAGDNLEGVAELLYRAGGDGGLIFEANSEDLDSDVANQASLQQCEPPLDLFLPHYQTTISGLLNLNVANYLFQTCPQNEITQQEQDCYLQSIFTHKFNQGQCFAQNAKNKHGKVYNNYNGVFEYNMISTPFPVIMQSLMLRSSLEYTNQRLQVRAISQIESISNIFVGHEDKLRQIHFQPQLLPEVIQLYHNTGIDHTKYDTGIKQVTKTESILSYLYDSISTPHHRFKLDHPKEYREILTKTIRNITRFRMNKIYTAGTSAWWEVLRNCADICAKTGFISTSLRCLVNVQLWSSVVDTLITIGRRGDATKLLKKVLRIPKDRKPNEILEEARKVRVSDADRAALGGFTSGNSNQDGTGSENDDAENVNGEIVSKKVNGDDKIDNADWELMFKDNDGDYGVDMDDIDEATSSSHPEDSTDVSTPPIKPITSSNMIRAKPDDDFDTKKIISTKSEEKSPKTVSNGQDSDDEDPDYQDGSLLSFVAKSMQASIHTTTTTSGSSILSASSYRLYHLLGEATQEPNYWDIAWELSHETYAPPQRSIAKYYAVRKFDEKAYECYKNALDLNGSDHQTWYEAGVVATRLKWYQKAIVCFSNALRIKPDISEGWNNLAACHLYLQNISSAYHALSQCLRNRRTSWKIWENFLQCALQLGYYNDVLSSLVQISQLKGKIDPMTLMPIQYTTDQSKIHVFSLYATWFEYLQPETRSELTHFGSIQPGFTSSSSSFANQVGPIMPGQEIDQETKSDQKHNNDNNNEQTQCSLCVQHPTENIMPGVEFNSATLFPLVQNFQKTAQMVLTNITHNESREKEMGGRILGGGDDSGAANSFSAQLDQLRVQQQYQNEQNNPTKQDDDDNAMDLGDSTNKQLKKRTNDEITAENFMQALSESAKGQKCILQHILGLSSKLISVQNDLVGLQQSSSEFEACINTLLKMCQDDAYNKTHMYHMEFILINFKLIFTNARVCDDHVLRHYMYGLTNQGDIDQAKGQIERSDANSKDMLLLLCNRILDNWRRDYNNNKLNLAHVLPMIEQLQSIADDVQKEIKVDDELWKTQFSTSTTAQLDTSNDFGGDFGYDPYGSFY